MARTNGRATTGAAPAAAQAQLESVRFSSITTDELVIPYPNGKPAIRMGMEFGGPNIEMLDKRGNRQMTLSVGDDGVFVCLMKRNGDIVATLGVNNELPSLSMLTDDADQFVNIEPEGMSLRVGVKTIATFTTEKQEDWARGEIMLKDTSDECEANVSCHALHITDVVGEVFVGVENGPVMKVKTKK